MVKGELKIGRKRTDKKGEGRRMCSWEAGRQRGDAGWRSGTREH
jgi:hypothetical protein